MKALPPSQQVDRRRRELREALAEIGQACERNDLPRITALVVDEATRLPGSWYFKSAGLGELPDEGRKEAWRREVDRIKKAAYPFELA